MNSPEYTHYFWSVLDEPYCGGKYISFSLDHKTSFWIVKNNIRVQTHPISTQSNYIKKLLSKNEMILLQCLDPNTCGYILEGFYDSFLNKIQILFCRNANAPEISTQELYELVVKYHSYEHTLMMINHLL